MDATFSIIGTLVMFGGLACVAAWLALPFIGLPGTVLVGRNNEPGSISFAFGSLVAGVCQSYGCLAYAAYIINWTTAAIRHFYLNPDYLWPVAFAVITLPILLHTVRTRRECQEDGRPSPLFVAACLALIATLVGFFVFLYVPGTIKAGWFWVPTYPSG